MPKGQKKSKEERQAEKVVDKALINGWRKRDKVSLEEALRRGAKSDRQARRYNLSRSYTAKFIKKWFRAELRGKEPFKDQYRGGIDKYSKAHKKELISDFIKVNNDPTLKTSMSQFCRANADKPGCNTSNISRWIKDDRIKSYNYRTVP